MFKIILGFILILLGIFLGLYIGLWVMLIGGIVQIINAVQVHPVNALGVAIGICRFLGAAICGWISVFACALIGLGFIKSGLKTI